MKIRTFIILCLLWTITEAAAQRLSSQGLSVEWSAADSLIMQDLSIQPLTSGQAMEAVEKLLDQAIVYNDQADPEKRLFAYIRALNLDSKLERYSITRVRLHSELSSLAGQLQSPRLAIRHARIALEIYSKMLEGEDPLDPANKEKFDRLYMMLGYTAGAYMKAGKNDSGLICYRKANEVARMINDPGATAASTNNIGIWHDMMGNTDSAAWYFNEAIRLQDEDGDYDIGLRYSIQDNQGQLYFRIGRYEEALALFRKNLGIYLEHQREKRTQTLAAISGTLLAINRLDEAKQYISLMEASLDSIPSNVQWKEKLFSLYMNYYIHKSDPQMALKYRQLGQRLEDSIEAVRKETQEQLYESLITLQIGGMQNQLELHQVKLSRKEEELQQEARYRLLLAVSISSFSLLVIAALVVYLRRRALLHRKEQELLTARNKLVEVELLNEQLESDKLKNELELKRADLSNVSMYLAHLCNQNDELFEELSQTRNLSEREQEASLRQIAQQLQLKMQADNKTGLLMKNVDKVNKEFCTNLSQRFPELSKAEIELCRLLKLNMSSTDIAAIKNIAPKSVKMSRYRLRKKLGLSPEADIYAFIQGI